MDIYKIEEYDLAYELHKYGENDWRVWCPSFEVIQKRKTGDVKRKLKAKYLKISTLKKYLYVRLYKNKKRDWVSIHRLIAQILIQNPLNKLTVDHIDGNSLNNSINNLRWATQQEQLINRQIPSTNTSGFRGVCFYKPTNKWQAQIKINGKTKYIGYYDTASKASEAYHQMSLLHQDQDFVRN